MSIMMFAASSIGNPGSINFLFPWGLAGLQASELFILVSQAGTLRNLHVRPRVVGTGTDVATFTVRVNGSATAITVNHTESATSSSDTTNSATVAAGDRVSMNVTTGGASVSGTDYELTFDYITAEQGAGEITLSLGVAGVADTSQLAQGAITLTLGVAGTADTSAVAQGSITLGLTISGVGAVPAVGETLSAIRKARASLLIRLAEPPWIYRIGQRYGVPSPPLEIPVDMYRRLVTLLAWQPKALPFTVYKLMEVVFGSQAELEAGGDRPWRIFEVTPNELIIELPALLLGTSNENASYLHGVTGVARVVSGPSNQFVTDGDVRTGSGTTLVGRSVYVFYSSTWNAYTVNAVSYNSVTDESTVTVSASTLPTGGGRFYIDVPGDAIASYRGDFLASSGFVGVFSTGAGPTDTISVTDDASLAIGPGQSVMLGLPSGDVPYTVSTASFDQTVNRTTIVMTASTIPGSLTNASIIQVAEQADLVGTPPHNDRVYLTGLGLYEVVKYYLDRLVRAAGVVVRLELI